MVTCKLDCVRRRLVEIRWMDGKDSSAERLQRWIGLERGRK